PGQSPSPTPPYVADEVERGSRTARIQCSSAYRVRWPHAKGGVGEIFIAEDEKLLRRVALKEIQSVHAQKAASRERFIMEAMITGSLEHPGIIPVYGMGTHEDGRPYYTMRFVGGEDLTTAIRRFHSVAAPDFMGLEFRWLLRRLIEVCN